MKTMSPVILFIFIIPVHMFGQATVSPTAEIKNLEEKERIAVTKGDTAALFALWSADYVVNNPNNMILTAAQIKKFARGSGMAPVSFSRNIEKISFLKDLAVVMGSETVTPADKNGNTAKPVYRRYTNIWIKTADGWKLSARQATNTLIQ